MVDWALAQRVAAGALILKPAPASYRSRDLQAQFDELTARGRVVGQRGDRTALGARDGPGQGDRPSRLGRRQRALHRAPGRSGAARSCSASAARKLGGPSLVVGRTVAGTQLGLMLAYMATRVLGQYDLLINDEAPEDQDLVSYVGPNIVAVEDAVRLRAEPVPAVARAARGDPPPAVHRGALAAGPLRRPGLRAARPALGRPGGLRRDGPPRRRPSCAPGATRPARPGSSACWPRPSSGWRCRRSRG